LLYTDGLTPLVLPLLLAAVSASDYVGSAACEKCHPVEFKAQSASAHARSLARSNSRQPGEWAFGAGEQAITFVTKVNAEYYREEGKSWYRNLNGYAPTPGARSAEGSVYRLFDPSGDILRCFSCHSTGPLTLAADDAIVPHELGVRCEACHGPAAAHVRSPAQSHPQNPGRLDADRLNEFCGACHRMPLGSAETVDFRNPWNVRHQPPTLAASACFRESKGRLSCLTCHSPHAPVERKLAVYDATCKTCHAAPAHRRPVANRSCVECHMPSVRPKPYLSFTNHRIATYAPSDPRLPVSGAK
jgi:hypothetical protein